ncbi:2365_t:CDS:2, partial [Acaulospora colombiana]
STRKRQPVESTLSDTPMSDVVPSNGGPNQAGNSAATSTPGPTGATTNGAPEMNKWIAIAEGKTYSPDQFRRMNGSDIGMEWILRDETAMKEPIVIEDPEGLGMKMPSKDMTVRDVANQVGPDTHVEVIGKMDTREMGRLLPLFTHRARQDTQCHFPRGLGYNSWTTDLTASTSPGTRLGRKALA